VGEIRVIQDQAGNCVVAIVQPDPPIRDQRTVGNSHGSQSPIELTRAMAKSAILEANNRVFDIPRPSTPKDAAIAPQGRPLPLKQRKKILASKLKRSR